MSRDGGELSQFVRETVDRLADDRSVDDATVAATALLLTRLARCHLAWLGDVLRDVDADESEAAVLLAMRLANSAITPRDLRSRLLLTSGGVTRTVDRLVLRGDVVRTADPSDGRSRLIGLTDAGAHRAGRLLVEVSTARERQLEHLDRSERERVLAAIDTLLALYPDLPLPP